MLFVDVTGIGPSSHDCFLPSKLFLVRQLYKQFQELMDKISNLLLWLYNDEWDLPHSRLVRLLCIMLISSSYCNTQCTTSENNK